MWHPVRLLKGSAAIHAYDSSGHLGNRTRSDLPAGAKDQAIIQVLAERLESQRLPLALALKERVDKGETLAEHDIIFLEEVFQDAQHVQSLMERHPEWQPLAAQMMHLYQRYYGQGAGEREGQVQQFLIVLSISIV